jgi:hypothetical protein
MLLLDLSDIYHMSRRHSLHDVEDETGMKLKIILELPNHVR